MTVHYFPALPDPPQGQQWPISLLRAHERLAAGHGSILATLTQDDWDPARIRALRNRFALELVPLLEAVEKSRLLDEEWLMAASHEFGKLLHGLDEAQEAAQQS